MNSSETHAPGTHHAFLFSTFGSDAYLFIEDKQEPSRTQALQQAEQWIAQQVGHAALVFERDTGRYIAQYASIEGQIVGSLLFTPQDKNESGEEAVEPLLSPHKKIVWEDATLLRINLLPGVEIWFYVENDQIVLSDHCLYDIRLP